jgi:hypothetical protein
MHTQRAMATLSCSSTYNSETTTATLYKTQDKKNFKEERTSKPRIYQTRTLLPYMASASTGILYFFSRKLTDAENALRGHFDLDSKIFFCQVIRRARLIDEIVP